MLLSSKTICQRYQPTWWRQRRIMMILRYWKRLQSPSLKFQSQKTNSLLKHKCLSSRPPSHLSSRKASESFQRYREPQNRDNRSLMHINSKRRRFLFQCKSSHRQRCSGRPFWLTRRKSKRQFNRRSIQITSQAWLASMYDHLWWHKRLRHKLLTLWNRRKRNLTTSTMSSMDTRANSPQWEPWNLQRFTKALLMKHELIFLQSCGIARQGTQ